MTHAAADLCLIAAVVAAWLAAAGFARLRAPLDRVHCLAFLNAASFAGVLLAGLLTEGPTLRVFKILLIMLVALLGGAGMAHATGRALVLRGTVEAERRRP